MKKINRRCKSKIKVCLECGKEFHPYYNSSTNKYCSWDCFKKKKYLTPIICKQCKKKFHPRSCKVSFCSRECAFLFKRSKNEIKCVICGKVFYPNRKSSQTCSPECWKLFRPVGRKRKDWKLMPTKGKNTSLDNLWRDCIRERAGGACEYCGKTTSLNSHHIFSRSNYNVRWDLSNGICLCVGHHIFGNFSAHKSPLEFCEWLKEVRGNDWYEALRIAAKQKVDLAQLKDNKKVELRNKLNELQRNKLNG